jgi:hypothetical protein
MTDAQFKELMSVVGMANETNRLVAGYQVEIDSRFKPQTGMTCERRVSLLLDENQDANQKSESSAANQDSNRQAMRAGFSQGPTSGMETPN